MHQGQDTSANTCSVHCMLTSQPTNVLGTVLLDSVNAHHGRLQAVMAIKTGVRKGASAGSATDPHDLALLFKDLKGCQLLHVVLTWAII